MNFILRSARPSDVDHLYSVAQQFSLLNLPADKNVLEHKIDKSVKSFKGELEKSHAKYMFVVEDIEESRVAGSSQIIAKHGNPGRPAFSFEVLKKERFSKDLGVGFIHQILRLKLNEDGPSEIGGLVLDQNYRGRPERIGKLCSLGRFLYLGMHPDKFEKQVYAQMAPPLTPEGRSHFWEALGRRFTGMRYQEADTLSNQNKEFIRSLFPEEDIYLCLLDAQARLSMGHVNQETLPALHMLQGVGFEQISEVDPFDGGPHIMCDVDKVSLVKEAEWLNYKPVESKGEFNDEALIGVMREHEFVGGVSLYRKDGSEICLPEKTKKAMQLQSGEKVYMTPMRSKRAKGNG